MHIYITIKEQQINLNFNEVDVEQVTQEKILIIIFSNQYGLTTYTINSIINALPNILVTSE